jgi:hypothetical protein
MSLDYKDSTFMHFDLLNMIILTEAGKIFMFIYLHIFHIRI